MSDSGANLGESLLEICDRICETARKGERNRKALAGSNFYGDQFHTRLVELSKIERSFLAAIDAGPIAESEVASAKAALSTIKSTSPQGGRRATALKNLRLFIHGSAIHALSNGDSAPAPASEPVLPKAVVIPANKSYLVTVVIQANASYEARCYDACAVMIRKLVEILIIELYEADKKEAEIKDGNGDYLMLSGLISKLQKTPHWHLARDTKSSLPKLKEIGDRAAHNRRFIARQGDVNSLLPGLRVLVDDLLHLARLK